MQNLEFKGRHLHRSISVCQKLLPWDFAR